MAHNLRQFRFSFQTQYVLLSILIPTSLIQYYYKCTNLYFFVSQNIASNATQCFTSPSMTQVILLNSLTEAILMFA